MVMVMTTLLVARKRQEPWWQNPSSSQAIREEGKRRGAVEIAEGTKGFNRWGFKLIGTASKYEERNRREKSNILIEVPMYL